MELRDGIQIQGFGRPSGSEINPGEGDDWEN